MFHVERFRFLPRTVISFKISNHPQVIDEQQVRGVGRNRPHGPLSQVFAFHQNLGYPAGFGRGWKTDWAVNGQPPAVSAFRPED